MTIATKHRRWNRIDRESRSRSDPLEGGCTDQILWDERACTNHHGSLASLSRPGLRMALSALRGLIVSTCRSQNSMFNDFVSAHCRLVTDAFLCRASDHACEGRGCSSKRQLLRLRVRRPRHVVVSRGKTTTSIAGSGTASASDAEGPPSVQTST